MDVIAWPIFAPCQVVCRNSELEKSGSVRTASKTAVASSCKQHVCI